MTPERAAEGVRADGYCVVPDVLSPDEVAGAIDALDEVFRSEDDIAADRRWLTDVYRVAYALPAKHPVFLELCHHPGLVGLAREVLGPDCVVAGFNGLSTVPGGRAQDLHADHPVPTPGTPLYLHLVCALDPFTVANGATRVVPGSHLAPVAPDRRDALEREAIPLAAPAGAAVAFDAALWHAASANATAAPRRALHVFFGRRWVQPHWDFPATLDPEVAAGLSDEQRDLLGFTARPRRFDRAGRRVVRGD